MAAVDGRWKVAIAGVGLIALVGGAIALAAEARTATYVAPFILGVVLLALAPNLERLGEITLTKSGISAKFGVSKEAATVIHRLGLADEMQTYAFVHSTLTDPADQLVKIKLQDALVEAARKHAFTHHVHQSDIDTLFKESQPAARVLGVGLALGNPTLASPDLYRAAIERSNSANEQYQGLVLAERNWSSLSDDLKAELVRIIKDNAWIPQDSDRRDIAERIVERWEAEPSHGRSAEGANERPDDGSDAPSADGG